MHLYRYHRIQLRTLAMLIWAITGCYAGTAQEFGRFHPGIKWQQINTPAIRVIYPEGLESQANRVAGTILHLGRNNRTSIGPLSRKLDLILNNQGVISNGYVTLMPFRSEFYTTPMQNSFALGSNPWLDLLAVHEYRHALQYMNMRRGYTKFLWLLTGDAGWGTLMNLTTPGWFFEGDAVATETALTNQGRGRMPSFLQLSKSILLNDRRYSYMKARNGSFRNQVPDSYELGYLLCSYGRDRFGNDLWNKVIRQTSTLKGIVYPFSDAVYANTRMNTRKFYKTALADFKEQWESEDQQINVNPFSLLSKPSATVTEYRFPVYQDNGDLLVYKESYKETGAICRISADGQENRICNLGLSLDPYFTASGNLIAWSEVTWDERYSSQSYSDVVIYDTGQSKKTRLTHKQRYFSPALSPDGTRLVVVESDPGGQCRLIILDSRTGIPLSALQNPDNLYFTYPKWDTDGTSIISSARTDKGSMLIIKQMIASGELIVLSPEWEQIIGEVMVTPESIMFSAGFSGINNIYAFSRSVGTLSQLTDSRFGAYHPAVSQDGKYLVYSDFDIRGYRLVKASVDSLLRKPAHPVPQNEMEGYQYSYFETEGGNILEKIGDNQLESSPYQRFQQAFRIHSWTLVPDLYSLGINLISDNILNKLHAEAGFRYYYTEKAPGIDAKISYGGWYPVLSAGLSRYYRHPDFIDVLLEEETDQAISVDNQLSFDVELPLNFSKGEYYREAGISLGYQFISATDLTEAGGGTSSVSAVSGHAGLTSTRKKALQNITTSRGMGLELEARRSIGFTRASLLQAIGDLAIRGLFPNHNLVLTAGVKSEPNANGYRFMDLFLYPRGYAIPVYDRMLTLQSSYHFPLLYPDLGFSGILYFSRIRADIFADYGYALIPDSYNNFSNQAFASVGAELIFDTKWFNLASIPLGIRFSLLMKPDTNEPLRKTKVEFIIPILRL